jgi:hypothetical protein
MTGIKNRLCPLQKAVKTVLCHYDKSNLCRHNFQEFKVVLREISIIQLKINNSKYFRALPHKTCTYKVKEIKSCLFLHVII